MVMCLCNYYNNRPIYRGDNEVTAQVLIASTDVTIIVETRDSTFVFTMHKSGRQYVINFVMGVEPSAVERSRHTSCSHGEGSSTIAISLTSP